MFAQSPESRVMPKQLFDAIGQIESNSPIDWDKSEAALQRAKHDPTIRNLATSSLALLNVKRGNLESVGNFLRESNKLFPESTQAQQSLLLRVQIAYDILMGTETATEAFSGLVHSTLKDTLDKNNRLASAAMLGTLIGMLELDAARSPIDRDKLTTAKDSLLKLKNIDLVNAFESSYRKAKAHADAITDWLAAHHGLSLDEVAKVATDCEQQLRVADQDRDQSADTIGRETKEHRKNIFQLSRRKDSITQEIKAVLFQWNCHPEIHNPIKPDRGSIRVQTTEEVRVGSHKEKKRKTRWNRKGEREEYYEEEEVDDYKTRRRKQGDIDRDIDAIYFPLLNNYNALKAAGQALLNTKASLDLEFQNAEAAIVAAKQAIEALMEKSKNEQKELRWLRDEAKIAKEVMMALKSGRPEAILRPPHFELFDYALETKALRNGLERNEK